MPDEHEHDHARSQLSEMELRVRALESVIFPTQVSADLEATGGLPRGYEQYRETRAKMLESYCFVLLSERRHLNTAVGIAMDAHSSQTGRRGGSEDLFAMRIDNWTDQMVAEAAEAKKHYDILQEDRLIKQNLSRDEFPILDEKTDDRRTWSKHKPSRMRFKKKSK